jgi:methyl-accepting chemotaxis protein
MPATIKIPEEPTIDWETDTEMNKFLRVVAVAAIITSILGILLAIVSIVSIWQINTPFTNGITALLEVSEKGLEIIDRGLTTVDPVVGLLAGSMADIQANGEQMKAQIEASNPIVDTLSLLLGREVGPRVDEALNTLQTVRQAAEEVNAASQTISALPFVQIPRITEATQKFVNLMNEIDSGVEEISRMTEELKQGISLEVIGPITERAALMEEELTGLQDEIQATNEQVKSIHQTVVTIRPMAATIIDAISVLLSVQLLWGGLAQAALIYLAWMYLKFGRIDLHNMLAAKGDM